MGSRTEEASDPSWIGYQCRRAARTKCESRNDPRKDQQATTEVLTSKLVGNLQKPSTGKSLRTNDLLVYTAKLVASPKTYGASY